MIRSRRIVTQEEKDRNMSCDTCRFLKSKKMTDGRTLNSCRIDGSIHGGEFPLNQIICKKYKGEENMVDMNTPSPGCCQPGVPVDVWGKKYRLMKKVYTTDEFVEYGIYDPSNERELLAMLRSVFEFGKYAYTDFKIEEVSDGSD